MKESNQKRPYESPKLFRVVLNHDQAILSGCSTSSTRVNQNTGANCRRGCRRANATRAADSAAGS